MVYSTHAFYSKKSEAIQMSINRRLEKQIHVVEHSAVMENKLTITTIINIDI